MRKTGREPLSGSVIRNGGIVKGLVGLLQKQAQGAAPTKIMQGRPSVVARRQGLCDGDGISDLSY